jgi:hypothetical protein
LESVYVHSKIGGAADREAARVPGVLAGTLEVNPVAT